MGELGGNVIAIWIRIQVIGLDAKGMSVMAVSSKERLHDVFQIFGVEKQLVVWALPVSS